MKPKAGIAAALMIGIALILLIACSNGDGRADDRGMIVVLAPILSVEVQVAESFPPQYFLQVESGLPNGCVEFDGYEVERRGETITVSVTNLEPADRDTPCTEIYRTVMTSIPLGSDFESGRTYTVLVNDVTETFSAQ
ncbi:MAG: hypothetical protein V3U35_03365 [Candidatus Neomarinimicrobiota bacterium]